MRLFSEEQLRLLLVNKITSPPSSWAILLPPTVFPDQACPRIWYDGRICLSAWLVWWTIHQNFIAAQVITYCVYNIFKKNFLMFSVEVNNLELLSIVQNEKLSLFYWLCPPAMTNLGWCFQPACRENTQLWCLVTVIAMEVRKSHTVFFELQFVEVPKSKAGIGWPSNILFNAFSWAGPEYRTEIIST